MASSIGIPAIAGIRTSVFPVDSGVRSRVYPRVMQASGIRIGELAKQTTLTVDTIRFYEKRRLLPRAPRTTGGFRLYTKDDIERLRFIRQMHGLGFSLREIGELTDLRTRKVDACESVRELLKHKVADIRAKMRELQRLETELVADLQKCNKELKHRQRHAACACPVLEEVATK
jgi:DNA-binding transcriptional MerR regulator